MKASAALLVPLLVAVFIPWGFLRVGQSISFPYDLFCVLFAVAAYYCVLADRFSLLCLVVALGVLNKETMVYFVPTYLFVSLRRNTPGAWRRAFILGVIFLAAYYIPRIFVHPINGALTVSYHDGKSMRWILNIRELLLQGEKRTFQNVYWPLSIHLPAFIRWRSLHPDLKRLYWGIPFLLVPIFLLGNIYELRLYNEILPLGALSCASLLDGRRSSREAVLPRRPCADPKLQSEFQPPGSAKG
jgi:hypothetical protein